MIKKVWWEIGWDRESERELQKVIHVKVSQNWGRESRIILFALNLQILQARILIRTILLNTSGTLIYMPGSSRLDAMENQSASRNSV